MTLRLLILSAVIILIFSGVTYYQFRQIQDLKTRNDELITIANDSARSATIYRNKYNELVSKNEVLTVDSKDARKLDEIKKTTKGFQGVRKDFNNLTQTTKIKAKIDTTLKITPVNIQWGHMLVDVKTDTTDRVLINDGYNYLALEPEGGLKITISVPITGVVYWEHSHKFWFLRWGKKKYYSEFKSENPLVELTNHEVIQIRKK